MKVGDKVRRLPGTSDLSNIWERKHILEVHSIAADGRIKFTEESVLRYFPDNIFLRVLKFDPGNFEILKPKRLVIR